MYYKILRVFLFNPQRKKDTEEKVDNEKKLVYDQNHRREG